MNNTKHGSYIKYVCMYTDAVTNATIIMYCNSSLIVYWLTFLETFVPKELGAGVVGSNTKCHTVNNKCCSTGTIGGSD